MDVPLCFSGMDHPYLLLAMRSARIPDPGVVVV